jgi:hypothetical protein
MLVRRTLMLSFLILALSASYPAAAQVPDLKTGGSVPTLAPVVRQVTPAEVNISVHGRVSRKAFQGADGLLVCLRQGDPVYLIADHRVDSSSGTKSTQLA